MLPASVAIAAALCLTAQAAAACRLALVLAMDVSNSVDAEEDQLQRLGLAHALSAPAVEAAFFAASSPVALAVFEWSGRHDQHMIQDWVLIDTPQTLNAVADAVATSRRRYAAFPTAIGYALGFAAGVLQRAPDCDAQTIDISGDGLNNDGFEPRDAIMAFDLAGVTVNGLVIEVPDDALAQQGPLDVATYYQRHVIHGPSAFVEIATGFEDFARAMEVKLIREVGVLILGQADPPEDRRE